MDQRDEQDARDQANQAFAFIESAKYALMEADTALRRAGESGGSVTTERVALSEARRRAYEAYEALGLKLGHLVRS